MTARVIHLLRHGPPLREGLLLGHRDEPARNPDCPQVRQRVRHLPVRRLVTSDLVRAAYQAEHLKSSMHVPLHIDRRWRELDFGLWEGLAPASPVLARVGPLFWARTLPPLHEGLGTMFRSGASPVALAIWFVAIIALAWLVAPALLAAPAAMVFWRWWLQRRLGGISGDGHGAGIELVESITLAAVVFAP